jgi:anti-anti-sigma factor
MNLKSNFDSENFLVDIKNGISIITIKTPRATFKYAEELKEILESMVFTNNNKIIIDFSDCEYADSMIIGIVVNIARTVRKNNGDVFVITPTTSIKVMFARTGLYKIFKQFWTREEAIEGFSN